MLNMNFRVKFLRIYANLPLNQRNEIVVVIDDEPMTWNAVRVEIENYTEKGKEILQKLVNLQIIK